MAHEPNELGVDLDPSEKAVDAIPRLRIQPGSLAVAQALLDTAGLVYRFERIDPNSPASSAARMLYRGVYTQLQSIQSPFYRA